MKMEALFEAKRIEEGGFLTFYIVNRFANSVRDGELSGSTSGQHAGVENYIAHYLHRILQSEEEERDERRKT